MACKSCHGPAGVGAGDTFPALAGQHAGFIAGQIEAWRNGSRSTDANGMMKQVADQMDAAQIKAVAAYLASLNLDGSPQVAAPVATVPKTAKKPTPKHFTLARYEKQLEKWKKGQPKRVKFTPPDDADIPAGVYGDMVRRGKELFNNPQL